MGYFTFLTKLFAQKTVISLVEDDFDVAINDMYKFIMLESILTCIFKYVPQYPSDSYAMVGEIGSNLFITTILCTLARFSTQRVHMT